MELQTLIDTYYADTLPNKRRSADSITFETHLEKNLMQLCNDINDHTLVPHAYAFVTMKPKPREVFACEMGMRIVHHYIEKRIRPILERLLSPAIFNNREGMGSLAAVNHLMEDIYEVSQGYTNDDCWIIKLDMQGYFPHASQDFAYHQLEELILTYYRGDDTYDLLYLLRVSIYSYPTHHCYRKSPSFMWCYIDDSKSLFNQPDGTGGAIGHLVWQCAMTFYMNAIILWLTREWLQHLTVYMDDMSIVTADKAMTLSLLPELRQRLADIGVTLHPRKFYCQHYTKGVEFIGYHIQPGRVYANNRCRRTALEKIGWYNRRVKIRNIGSFVASVNSYLGVFKNVCGHHVVEELLRAICHEWWEFVEYDARRICIRPKEAYNERNLLIKTFKIKHYDKRRVDKTN